MKTVYFYRSDDTDPAYNLALEQYLFERKERGEICILLWRSYNTVVVGRYQNVYEEADIDYAEENNIKIVRRMTGGGAVYHDLGNLNYSFIIDHPDTAGDLDFCMEIIKSFLEKFDLKYAFEGRNDITVRGFKISGSARHIGDGKMLHHGTLLVNSDLETVRRVLTRKNKPDMRSDINPNTKSLKSIRSVKSIPRRVGNIMDLASIQITAEDAADAFAETVQSQKSDDVRIAQLSELIKAGEFDISRNNPKISRIIMNRYGSDRWNCGFFPDYGERKSRRFPSGTVCINADISDGMIRDIKFSGDFFSLKDIGILERGLTGLRIDENLKNMLVSLGADEFIEGVSAGDISEIIMSTYSQQIVDNL